MAGGEDSDLLQDPTAVVMANDERSVYIALVGGTMGGGQVIKVKLLRN